MTQDSTARHILPNLFANQAQKELIHNEALARIDGLLHPVIEERLAAPPAPLSEAEDGLCWLVDAPATGVWQGKEGQIALRAGGSWRFLAPVDGMTVWHRGNAVRLFYIDDNWVVGAGISNPLGGTVVDAEARTALIAILDHLRLISSIAS
jgi:hypothetical protein